MAKLSRDQLLARVAQLEAQLEEKGIKPSTEKLVIPPRAPPTLAHSPYNVTKKPGPGPLPDILARAPKRHVAFLFSYEGWAHSGLAYQPIVNPTPLTTVEACILEALEQARLIEPTLESDGFGCGFERCGRTDAGVSSSAQVINLWVRSALPDPMGVGLPEGSKAKLGAVEIPYVPLLNRFLPSSIQILAWSPVAADFSSRFSCIWRHYKYFFSISPSEPFIRPRIDFGSLYPPPPTASTSRTGGDQPGEEQWKQNLRQVDFDGLELSVPAMQDAAARLIGEHDFRNMCKVDPPKQLSNHLRAVSSASIDRVDGESEDMYVLNLRGGAFLYNQVRHIVALLFLVGAKLESPEIIDRLIWTSDTEGIPSREDGIGRTREKMDQLKAERTDWEKMDRKPGYEMADDLSLILWACGFNKSEFRWRIGNETQEGDVVAGSSTPSSFGPSPHLPESTTISHSSSSSSLSEMSNPLPHRGSIKTPLDPSKAFSRQFLEMNRLFTETRIKSIILKHHLTAFCAHTPPPTPTDDSLPSTTTKSARTPLGSGRFANMNHHIPILKRQRAELPDVANAAWAAGRGAAKMAARADNQVKADAIRERGLGIKEAARQEARDVAAEAKRLLSDEKSI